jgi:ankyrin repeat protein
MSDELYKACADGDVAKAQACLARGVNVNDKYCGLTPLMIAVLHNNIEIVRILLARDDLDITTTYFNGITALHYACGKDIRATHIHGCYTALHFACYKGSAECVALLGKDRRMNSNIINTKNNYGNTALMMAVQHDNLSCVEMMAELDGVDWETTDEDGESLEDVARWVFDI